MTDTMTNIRRIAEIIRAIDTSVASISTIKIYPLQYANAKELATVITQLFAQSGTGSGGAAAAAAVLEDWRFRRLRRFWGGPGGGDPAVVASNKASERGAAGKLARHRGGRRSKQFTHRQRAGGTHSEYHRRGEQDRHEHHGRDRHAHLPADQCRRGRDGRSSRVLYPDTSSQNSQRNGNQGDAAVLADLADRETSRTTASRAGGRCSRRKWWPWAIRGRTRCS